MKIETFFDKDTFTLTHIVSDEKTKDSVIIDSVLDYDPRSSTYSYDSINKVTEYIEGNELKIHFIMETHAHADHLTGSQELKRRFPEAKVVIGNGITKVQQTFKSLFNLSPEFPVDGRQYDQLIADNEVIEAGSLKIKALYTPGHTEACSSYLIGDAVFTGDALFMPDYGVARCDFPKGSAHSLFKSITERLYTLPDDTRVFVNHDYQPGGRELKFQSTIGEEKKNNVQLNEKTTEEEFVKFRTNRDSQLAAPKLLLPSIQVNINAGNIPEPEQNGISYLKIPIKKRKET